MIHPDPDPRPRQARVFKRLSRELRSREGKIRDPRARRAVSAWSRGLDALARALDRYRIAGDEGS